MRLVVIGDIGVVDGMLHIGDEAMFEATAGELADRGVEVVAISAAPAESAARYGLHAIARIGFAGLGRPHAEQRMAAALASVDGVGLASDDPAHAVIAAIAASDGVVIAGGGNLASTWPLHVYERATIAGITRRLGRPLVVSGQTFGPYLGGRERELVGDIVRSASMVGVREEASRLLAADLGVEARLGVDDASFLGRDAAADGGVLVSLSLYLGGAERAATVRRLTSLIDAAADAVAAPVTFHAHFGRAEPGPARGDALLHDEVRAGLRYPSSVVPTGTSRDAAALARGAKLLITGRYHPAVFAAPAGVPVLGLVTDEYTAVKQRGALAHWGQSTTVPITEADGAGTRSLGRLWSDRAVIASEAARRHPLHRSGAREWWDLVVDAFR